jgi:hypothetical protein
MPKKQKKKIVKKSAKKAKSKKKAKKAIKPRKKIVSKKAKKSTSKAQDKPIGRVTHFFTNIKVAVIKFKVPFKTGGAVRFKGATTDFAQKLSSMQYDHAPVAAAKKGQGVGVKVQKRVREGDLVFVEK